MPSHLLVPSQVDISTNGWNVFRRVQSAWRHYARQLVAMDIGSCPYVALSRSTQCLTPPARVRSDSRQAAADKPDHMAGW